MAFTIAKLMTAIVIFSVVVMGLTSFYASMTSWYPDYYNSTADSYLGESYQQVNETFEIAEDISDKLRNSTSTEATALDSAILGATSSFRLVWNSFGIVINVGEAIQEDFYIAEIFISALITLFTVFIAFAIIDAYFRR